MRAQVHGEPAPVTVTGRVVAGGKPIDGRARDERRRCCSTSLRSAPTPTIPRAASRGTRSVPDGGRARSTVALPPDRSYRVQPYAFGLPAAPADLVRRSREADGRHRRHHAAGVGAPRRPRWRRRPARRTADDDVRRAGAGPGRRRGRRTRAAQLVRPVPGLRSDARPAARRLAGVQPRDHVDGQLRSADPARPLLRLRDTRAIRDDRPRRDHRRPGRRGDAAGAAGRAVADRSLPRGALSGDFHVHGAASFDSSIPDQDRVAQLPGRGRRRRRSRPITTS